MAGIPGYALHITVVASKKVLHAMFGVLSAPFVEHLLQPSTSFVSFPEGFLKFRKLTYEGSEIYHTFHTGG